MQVPPGLKAQPSKAGGLLVWSSTSSSQVKSSQQGFSKSTHLPLCAAQPPAKAQPVQSPVRSASRSQALLLLLLPSYQQPVMQDVCGGHACCAVWGR